MFAARFDPYETRALREDPDIECRCLILTEVWFDQGHRTVLKARDLLLDEWRDPRLDALDELLQVLQPLTESPLIALGVRSGLGILAQLARQLLHRARHAQNTITGA